MLSHSLNIKYLLPNGKLCMFIAAEFLTSVARHAEACEQRVKAAELSPNDYSLVVSAATGLRLSDRKVEAEMWYRMVCTV